MLNDLENQLINTVKIDEQTDEQICCIFENSELIFKLFKVSIAKSYIFPIYFLAFRYNLLVTSIEPREGSLGGGTRVTIAGSGFGSTVSDVKVSFGDSLCDVISVNVSTIVCVTHVNVAGNHTMNVS